MSQIEVGCCGAYCRTCRAFRSGHCKGCKLGYADGQRDLKRAKCKMKLCCLVEHGLSTCADCPEFETCELLQGWYGKAAGKYKRYKKSAEFIRAHGYEAFMDIADNWKDACGKLEPKPGPSRKSG
jgi:hypothetical protein